MTDFIIKTSPSPDEIDIIYQGLLSYNQQFFNEVKHTPLAIFKEENGQKIAGICGDILGNWLRIRYLWVSEDNRHQKLGSKLLQAIETEAIKLGAKFVELDTFSFQALPFYKKHGYTIFGTLENYPISEQKYFLHKTLETPH